MTKVLTKVHDEKKLEQFLEPYLKTGFQHPEKETSQILSDLGRARAEVLWKTGNYHATFNILDKLFDPEELDRDLLLRTLERQLKVAEAESFNDIINERYVKTSLKHFRNSLENDFPLSHVTAEALIRNGQPVLAEQLLALHAQTPVVNLALANTCSHEDSQWLKYVNSFFSLQESGPISLLDGDSKRFFRLDADGYSTFSGGPKISVIMTAHNMEQYIGTAIRSALSQTWKNFELLVVDDLSTDHTRQIVRKFMSLDDRIKLIENNRNCGTYVSRNKAYDIASGRFITCHDSDDWAHPKKLELQIHALLKNPDAVSSTSHWVRMHENGRFAFYKAAAYQRRNYNSLMFEKSRIKPVLGYWDSVRISADSEFIKRMGTVFGEKSQHSVDQVLMIGLKRNGSLTNSGDTGLKPHGPASIRQKYHHSYSDWHKSIDKHTAYIDFPQEKRAFEAPEEIVVPNYGIR
ncbi:MAG: glycosyltransferase family 2 protein [Prosthecochloris sp.]|nr:glycosyltransferase family 2 protein [Prosthecochloris sp.]